MPERGPATRSGHRIEDGSRSKADMAWLGAYKGSKSELQNKPSMPAPALAEERHARARTDDCPRQKESIPGALHA